MARTLRDEAPLSVWKDLISNFEPYLIDVAQNGTIPEEIFKDLIHRGDERIRSILAEKRRLPSCFFDFLSNDASPLVRKAIAANRKAPIDVLKRLVLDQDEGVARVAKYQLKER
jgi:hypothetical protein